MILPIKQILLEVESYDPNYLLNLIGQINSFKPFINCSEEQDRGNRVKRDMIGLITGTQQAINQGRSEWYGSFSDPNPLNPNTITESANTIGGKIMRTMVHARKPFKTYGKVLPRKPDTSSLDNKAGPGKLFSYEDLLKDTRPMRQSNLGV